MHIYQGERDLCDLRLGYTFSIEWKVLKCLSPFGYHSSYLIFKRELRKYPYFTVGQYLFFAIQKREDDTQDGIDQDQPLKEKTLLMMESTPSRENRNVILDVTLFSENLAEVHVSNWKAKVFAFSLLIPMAVLAVKTIFAPSIIETYTKTTLVNAQIIIEIGIYKRTCTKCMIMKLNWRVKYPRMCSRGGHVSNIMRSVRINTAKLAVKIENIVHILKSSMKY